METTRCIRNLSTGRLRLGDMMFSHSRGFTLAQARGTDKNSFRPGVQKLLHGSPQDDNLLIAVNSVFKIKNPKLLMD